MAAPHPQPMTHSAPAPFPPTRYSVVAAAGAPGDAEAFGVFVEAYWKPVYKYVRLRWHAASADAEDLTQSFFARAFEKEYLGAFDASRARFRTFLRICVDRFVMNERLAAHRQKRGGMHRFLPLDVGRAEQELRRSTAHVPSDFDTFFEREWMRSVFGRAVAALRKQCMATGRERRFRTFARYDLRSLDGAGPVTYAGVARELGISVTDVTNELSAARRQFRACVRDQLRRLTASEDEFRAEAQRLLGPRFDDLAV
jgi:RNA polymerase sigma factor (sigma-70 family)